MTQGHFYLIQTMPESAPEWIKLGYSTNVADRLRTHQTTCPQAKLIKTWSCKSSDERKAIAAVTGLGCKRISSEVYLCTNIPGLIERADTFFGVPGAKVLSLKELRECEAILTQEELALECQVSKQTVYDWERGKYSPRAKQLRALIKALNRTPREVRAAIQNAKAAYQRRQAASRT